MPIIIIPALFFLIGWLAWVLTRTRHLRVKAQVEIQKQLLEKIHSTEDVAQLLQSAEGRQFLEAVSISRPISAEEILSSVQKGVILSVVGLGGLFLRWLFPMGYGVLIIAAVMTGAVGIGFLISSAISYRLSKSWGLMTATSPADPKDRARDAGLFQ